MSEVDEQSRLLDSESHDDASSSTVEQETPSLAIWTVVPILLLGVFVANADGSLVITTSGHIASEFNALSEASWLVTSYSLAQCASQPMYGKLSDIFGRRSNLIGAYALFIGGCFICGIGRQYWQVLTGRAISGIGGAGMNALVSVIIADLVPPRDVASWRSYVNVAATTGRALGGPVGGFLVDSVGWRWSFYGQCLPTLLSLLLVLWKMPPLIVEDSSDEDDHTLSFKFSRIDFAGSITLAGTISSFLLALEFAASRRPWPVISITAGICFVFGIMFYFIERRFAKEPILPIELISKPAVYTSYLIVGLQMAGQFGIFNVIPIYFQISQHMSVTGAGARLVPSVIGNTIGGLLSGYIINRTGRYKWLSNVASLSASIAYMLLVLRWHGHIHPVEILEIVPGGFGTGIIQSTTFMHLVANLDQSDISIAGTAHYLSQGIGLLVGISLSASVLNAKLRTNLEHDLRDIKHKHKIIARVEASVDNIWTLPEHVQRLVIKAYVDGLIYCYALGFSLAFMALLIGFTIRERKL